MGRLSAELTVRLDKIYLYQQAYNKFVDINNRFLTRLGNTNQVLDKYQQQFPKLSRQVLDLAHEIAISQKGTVDTQGLDLGTDMLTDNVSQSITNRAICKGLFRELASEYHPDRGGDVNTFKSILNEYKQGNIDGLLYIQVQLKKRKCIVWQQTEGITYWNTMVSKVNVKLHKLEARPEYEVFRYHMQSNVVKAKETMYTLLTAKILVLTAELNHLYTRR